MTPEPPPDDRFINLEGPKGDSLFCRLVSWCLPLDFEEWSRRRLDDVWKHVSVEDDRALALIGALVLENGTDELLAAFIPGYQELADNRDFSFSLKIGLARSLRLMPSRLHGGADTVRRIRNTFAHNLEVTSFAQCQPKLISSMRGHLREIHPLQETDKPDRDAFRSLVGMLYVGLLGYGHHVRLASSFMREADEFGQVFEAYCREKWRK